MKIFTQSIKYSTNRYVSPDCFEKLPGLISKYTDLDYTYQKKNGGCFLYPSFGNMSCRNAFVPEIDIVFSSEEADDVICISGRPVKVVRIFMTLWFVFSLLAEGLLIVDVLTAESDSLELLIPFAIGVFGFLVCKLFTKAAFDAVVKVIKREFS